MSSIRTSRLTKYFGTLRAVNEITLDLPQGGVAGFVGPNGAGKSTTIRMLLGLIKPTSGKLSRRNTLLGFGGAMVGFALLSTVLAFVNAGGGNVVLDGLGYLLFKSAHFSNFLGVLVVIAGCGYTADTFTRILVPGSELTFSTFSFVGEALLIVWLVMRAVKGFAPEGNDRAVHVGEPRLTQPATVSP